MRMKKKILAWFICLMLPASVAQAIGYATPGQFIGYKTLVTFWNDDCSQCARQLPIMIQVAKYNPDAKFYYIFLGDYMSSENLARGALPSNLLIFNVSEAATTLRSFGATADMLPFSAVLRNDGTICRSRAGVQGVSTLEDWMEKC